MTEIIKACPFCGASGEDVYAVGSHMHPSHYITCQGCQTYGPDADTEAEAIQKWNAAADRIEELEAENERLWAYKMETMSMKLEDIDVLTDPPPIEKEQRND